MTTRECTVKLRNQEANLVVTQTKYRFECKFAGREQLELGIIKEEPYGAAWYARGKYLRKALRGKATSLELAFERLCQAGLVVPVTNLSDEVLADIGRTFNLDNDLDPDVRAFFERTPTAKSRRDLVKALRDHNVSHLDLSDPGNLQPLHLSLPDLC